MDLLQELDSMRNCKNCMNCKHLLNTGLAEEEKYELFTMMEETSNAEELISVIVCEYSEPRTDLNYVCNNFEETFDKSDNYSKIIYRDAESAYKHIINKNKFYFEAEAYKRCHELFNKEHLNVVYNEDGDFMFDGEVIFDFRHIIEKNITDKNDVYGFHTQVDFAIRAYLDRIGYEEANYIHYKNSDENVILITFY